MRLRRRDPYTVRDWSDTKEALLAVFVCSIVGHRWKARFRGVRCGRCYRWAST